jgi:hypothetical protein
MSNIMQDLHTAGLNSFAVTLLAESLLKSPLAPMTVGQPQTFEFPVQRSDCPGWVGVRITLEAIPAEQPWTRDNARTLCLLLLCGGHDVTEEAISGWTNEQCQQAEDWAAREHLHASDNDDVERLPMPLHVKAHPSKPATNLDLWG